MFNKIINSVKSAANKPAFKKGLIIGGSVIGAIAVGALAVSKVQSDESVVIEENEDGSFTVSEASAADEK